MVKLLMGLKGSGKTKHLIELVNDAIHNEKGSVICIERGKKLTYDINYKARLIDISTFSVDSYAMLRGFLCGLYAGNYDISHIFIDNLYKASGEKTIEASSEFIDWLGEFSKEHGVRITVTISEPAEEATENMKKVMEVF